MEQPQHYVGAPYGGIKTPTTRRLEVKEGDRIWFCWTPKDQPWKHGDLALEVTIALVKNNVKVLINASNMRTNTTAKQVWNYIVRMFGPIDFHIK
jgi:hypothetical protein